MNTSSPSNASGRTSCNALPQPNHTNQSDPPTLHKWVKGHSRFNTTELNKIRLTEWLNALPSSFPEEELNMVSESDYSSDYSKDTSGKIEKRTSSQKYLPSPLKNSLVLLAVATIISAILHQWQSNLSQES